MLRLRPRLDLTKEVLEVLGSPSAIVFQEFPEDDPKVREPDITLARRILGWEPRVDHRGGFTRAADYFRRKLS